MAEADFLSHKHPVLAVKCARCYAKPGQWCQRPSGHGAPQLHKDRRVLADEVFIQMHGERASIERMPDGGWKIDPTGLAPEKATKR